jgi:hypothetical protein
MGTRSLVLLGEVVQRAGLLVGNEEEDRALDGVLERLDGRNVRHTRAAARGPFREVDDPTLPLAKLGQAAVEAAELPVGRVRNGVLGIAGRGSQSQDCQECREEDRTRDSRLTAGE